MFTLNLGSMTNRLLDLEIWGRKESINGVGDGLYRLGCTISGSDEERMEEVSQAI